MTNRICVFEGDDAAPEAIRPTIDLLEALDADLTFETPPIDDYESDLDDGTVPDELGSAIEAADSVLFGSASDRHLPIIWYLRYEYGDGLPVNLRPVRYIDGATSALADPHGIDYVIARENLEGLYFRVEGDLKDLPRLDRPGASGRVEDLGGGKYAIRVASERNLRRFARLACELAADRGSRVTCSTKSNVLPQTDGLFARIVEETTAEFGLEYEHLHADDLGQRLVTDPHRFDVILTPNFAGDVLSDVGAGTIGGLGLAPSGCYSEEAAYFEPVHGTAPDIAGTNSINPTATILSAAMMLEYLDLAESATRLRHAVEAVYAAGEPLTPDQGGAASTTEMATAIRGHL